VRDVEDAGDDAEDDGDGDDAASSFVSPPGTGGALPGP
jgi:hypothetical protein